MTHVHLTLLTYMSITGISILPRMVQGHTMSTELGFFWKFGIDSQACVLVGSLAIFSSMASRSVLSLSRSSSTVLASISANLVSSASPNICMQAQLQLTSCHYWCRYESEVTLHTGTAALHTDACAPVLASKCDSVQYLLC